MNCLVFKKFKKIVLHFDSEASVRRLQMSRSVPATNKNQHYSLCVNTTQRKATDACKSVCLLTFYTSSY